VPSEQSRPVVEATLPVVGAHVGEIASRFYRHLFAEHPELLDGVFNRGNQARGEQQRSLAGSERGLYSARGVRPETVWRPWRVEK
jgi:nitric oxide dioxygenase